MSEHSAHLPASRSVLRRVSNFLYHHRTFSLILLLAPPLLWLVIFYLGALAAMLRESFYFQSLRPIDAFNYEIVKELSLGTYKLFYYGTESIQSPARGIIQRSLLMAIVVTFTSGLMAFPLAYYMARYARSRMKGLLYLAVMLPLWSSYIVRVYTWKIILADKGAITWTLDKLGLRSVLEWILDLPEIGGPSLSFSYIGLYLVFVYIWMPYMILPISAALERVPKSVIEASGDLGARPGYTFWRITLPLAFPGVVAGSIFTFSLTLGDYIIPRTIGDPSSTTLLGSVIEREQATNFPLAAVYTVVTIVIMIIYLFIAKRLGAFDAL